MKLTKRTSLSGLSTLVLLPFKALSQEMPVQEIFESSIDKSLQGAVDWEVD